MEQPVTAVYDANILYPAPLRDLFIRIAQAGLVRARWTDTIHDEWLRNVLMGKSVSVGKPVSGKSVSAVMPPFWRHPNP
jgi:hypothetical protein